MTISEEQRCWKHGCVLSEDAKGGRYCDVCVEEPDDLSVEQREQTMFEQDVATAVAWLSGANRLDRRKREKIAALIRVVAHEIAALRTAPPVQERTTKPRVSREAWRPVQVQVSDTSPAVTWFACPECRTASLTGYCGPCNLMAPDVAALYTSPPVQPADGGELHGEARINTLPVIREPVVVPGMGEALRAAFGRGFRVGDRVRLVVDLVVYQDGSCTAGFPAGELGTIDFSVTAKQDGNDPFEWGMRLDNGAIVFVRSREIEHE